jgi:hypothetical protein
VKIGLQGPMRATTATPEFVAWAQTLFKRIGQYPAGFLIDSPKQGTRMLKCECPRCGYIARVSGKWLASSGPPICPTDKIALSVTSASDDARAAASRAALRKARDARHRARVREGRMVVDVEIDGQALDWLILDAHALDERLLEHPDPRQVRQAAGKAISALAKISSLV